MTDQMIITPCNSFNRRS